MKNLFYLITVILFLTSSYNIVKMEYLQAFYFVILGVLSLIMTENMNYSLIKRFWNMKIAPKFRVSISHILGVLFIVSLTSCRNNQYNVQLKNGSIVTATNNLNTYQYEKGDTVCLKYFVSTENWYFSKEMIDTSYTYIKYYIGVIK